MLDDLSGGTDVRLASGDVDAYGLAGKVSIESASGDVTTERHARRAHCACGRRPATSARPSAGCRARSICRPPRATCRSACRRPPAATRRRRDRQRRPRGRRQDRPERRAHPARALELRRRVRRLHALVVNARLTGCNRAPCPSPRTSSNGSASASARRCSRARTGCARRWRPTAAAICGSSRRRPRRHAEGDRLLRESVAGARRAGHSWDSIGSVLGVSRQAVQQRFRVEPGEEPDANRRVRTGVHALNELDVLAVRGPCGQPPGRLRRRLPRVRAVRSPVGAPPAAGSDARHAAAAGERGLAVRRHLVSLPATTSAPAANDRARRGRDRRTGGRVRARRRAGRRPGRRAACRHPAPPRRTSSPPAPSIRSSPPAALDHVAA